MVPLHLGDAVVKTIEIRDTWFHVGLKQIKITLKWQMRRPNLTLIQQLNFLKCFISEVDFAWEIFNIVKC